MYMCTVGSKGLVIGSLKPWAEAALLAKGAIHLTSVDFVNISTDHPQITTIRPDELYLQYTESGTGAGATTEPVDFIFTYSSLEHSGLGRYGDPLQAHGDILSIAKLYCLLPEGGMLFLGLPVGLDRVEYNANRIYGFKRMAVILALGFNLVDVMYHETFSLNLRGGERLKEPIFVLQKKSLDD